MGRLEPGQSGPWWEKDSSKKPQPGGSDPEVNAERLRDKLGDKLAYDISVEAQMLYLARHAKNSEINKLFASVIRGFYA